MALHDPDSTAKEKAIALKIGRQKKIQIIDGMYNIKMFDVGDINFSNNNCKQQFHFHSWYTYNFSYLVLLDAGNFLPEVV